MHVSTRTKQYLIGGFILAGLVAINIAVFVFFARPGLPPHTFGGKVATVSDHTLTVVDVRSVAHTFTIASTTDVVLGRKATPETTLTEGTFVLVTAESSLVAATATKIRLMSTDSFNRPPKPVTP